MAEAVHFEQFTSQNISQLYCYFSNLSMASMALALPHLYKRIQMAPELVAGHIVKRCLKVGKRTLQSWQTTGYLTSANETRWCYHSADLDALLAKGAQNFEKPPTIADLITGQVNLLTPREAAAILKMNQAYLGKHIKPGALAAVKLGEWRYCKASVKKWAAMRAGLTNKQIAHILGISPSNVSRLTTQGKLIRGSQNSYTKQSVLALLAELLPPHQYPTEWLEDRLASSQPLLTISNAAPTVKDKKRIYDLMGTGQVHYIHAAADPTRRRVLISPDSLLAYLQRTEDPLTKEDLALLFGVSIYSIYRWDASFKDWRKCPAHDHQDDSLYKDCVIFVLQRYLTPRASATRWYSGRFEGTSPVIGTAEATRILGFTNDKHVEKMVRSGYLTALWTPSGYLRFSKMNVEVKKRRNAKSEAARSE